MSTMSSTNTTPFDSDWLDDIVYDIGGPSDLADRGEPLRIVPRGIPRAARNHNYLLEIKSTRDDEGWERSREAYRWVPDAAVVAESEPRQRVA